MTLGRVPKTFCTESVRKGGEWMNGLAIHGLKCEFIHSFNNDQDQSDTRKTPQKNSWYWNAVFGIFQVFQVKRVNSVYRGPQSWHGVTNGCYWPRHVFQSEIKHYCYQGLLKQEKQDTIKNIELLFWQKEFAAISTIWCLRHRSRYIKIQPADNFLHIILFKLFF